MGGSTHPQYSATLQSLAERLNDYGGAFMPSSQRRFLMRRLIEVAPDCPPFPTLAAEALAAEYLKNASSPPEPGK